MIGIGNFDCYSRIVMMTCLIGLLGSEQMRGKYTMPITTVGIGVGECFEDSFPVACVGVTAGNFEGLVELGLIFRGSFRCGYGACGTIGISVFGQLLGKFNS